MLKRNARILLGIRNTSLSVLLASLFVACGTQSTSQEHIPSVPPPTSATVVVGSLKGAIQAGSTLSWYKENFIDLSDSAYLSADEQRELSSALEAFVESAFREKGIHFSDERGSTRYQIIVAGAGSNSKVQELHGLFKVYPGLGHHEVNHGAVMIAVVDTARNYALWRGVVEGQVQSQLSFDQRLQRLNTIVSSLLNRIEL